MSSKQDLIELLQRREATIADHVWRDRDPADHLEALKQVSMAIADWSSQHRESIDPKLAHYLGNASYAKALQHLEQLTEAD